MNSFNHHMKKKMKSKAFSSIIPYLQDDNREGIWSIYVDHTNRLYMYM